MPLFTRDAFERQRAAVKQVERREGRLLATVSIVFGLGSHLAEVWPRQSRAEFSWRTWRSLDYWFGACSVVFAPLAPYARNAELSSRPYRSAWPRRPADATRVADRSFRIRRDRSIGPAALAV